MTISWSKGVLVTALCLFAAACGRLAPPDRPSNVDANDWIPISPTAGIAVTRIDRAVPIVGRDAAGEPNVRMAFRGGTGVLMVKIEGLWTRIDLELPAPHVQRLL